MTRRLEGRVALVTGAGKGIGRAIAARLLDEGAHVALVEQDQATGEDARDELGARGPVLLVVADVTDDAAMQRAVAATAEWAGGLDVLVNNAGIADPHHGGLASGDLDAFRRILDVNLVAPFMLVRHAQQHLRARRGAIVNISSTRAVMSEPNSEGYAASKGGLGALTHALSLSLGPHVRVNAIAPGWIATGSAPKKEIFAGTQTPVGRAGTPDEVAALALFLASKESSYVTGQMIVVDGGNSIQEYKGPSEAWY
jgi:NAD(P)-dependent dehydrogenase (short-subunit alcohol dehydrogenase family)